MNTAPIVVLTVAIGADGIAAYLASGSDDKPAGPAAQITLELKPEQSETLARARQTGTLALRSITDANAVEVMSDEQGSRRGESVSVVRYGLASSQTVQK
jgi:Flp pilus assembly protein CpaB